MSITFAVEDAPLDITLPPDTIPETAQVEYPCEACGREAGPYKGRGRKPKRCEDCKPKRSVSNAPRVSGTTANLAAQATEVLSQLNAFACIGLSAIQMFGTAGEIARYDETFKAQAYAALITDQELCKYILKGGVKSAKLALLLAYGGLAVSVGPTAMQEVKAMQEERKARKLAKEAENGI